MTFIIFRYYNSIISNLYHFGDYMDSLSNKTNYYNSIDLFKFIFSYFIIAIHTTPLVDISGNLEFFTSVLWKIAVPFYFATSGFLFFKKLKFDKNKVLWCKDNNRALRRYLFRLTVLYLFWSAVYILYKFITIYHGHIDIHIIKDFIFSIFITGSYYHLWYLLCLIYATIFIYVVLLIVDYRFFVIIAMFLYLVGIVTYSYRWLIDISSLNIIADRFECVFYSIVRAAPLMIVGVMSSQMNRRIDVKHDAIIVIILFALLLIESFIVKSNYDNKYSYVVLTLPLCFYTFNLISG